MALWKERRPRRRSQFVGGGAVAGSHESGNVHRDGRRARYRFEWRVKKGDGDWEDRDHGVRREGDRVVRLVRLCPRAWAQVGRKWGALVANSRALESYEEEVVVKQRSR